MSETRRRLTFDRERCLACRACELACAVAHSASGTLIGALGEAVPPKRRVFLDAVGGQLRALRCKQCREPLCVFSCKSGALHRDPATGRTVFDEDLCVGCWMCVMVCPDGVRPDLDRHQAVRCDVCADREVPACVAACPTATLRVEIDERPRPVSDFAEHLVVVGSSAAGVAACEAAREVAPAASITLVTADTESSYSRPMLAYLLSRKIDREDVHWRAQTYLEEQLGVQLRMGVCASGLSAADSRLHLSDGSTLHYDRLIIATGARGMRVEIPGAELPGVYTLRDIGDLDAIQRCAGPGGRAVVLGGGNVGLQVCEALLDLGMQVAVVVRSPHLLSQMVDAGAGERTGRLFELHGLVLRTGRDAVEILGPDRVRGVRLDDGETLEAGLVVVGKGIQPNVEWLEGSGVYVGRGVRVDAQCRSNVPDVFAAGDCAESEDPLTGAYSVSGIWPVAYEMGRTAGRVATGVERIHPGPLRMNASKFFGVPIVSIGEVRSERLRNAREWILADDEDDYRKLVFHDGRLAGAVLFGDISGAGMFYRLYREGRDLRDLTEQGPDEVRLREAWYAERGER
jgi:NADPH-dependent 2,4-dienoyl-CoA reductase/sulfur reductase-like enzyme/ferredoxin